MTLFKASQIYYPFLALALVARLGRGYGLPLFTQGDGPSLVSGSLRMLQYKTLIPALEPGVSAAVLPAGDSLSAAAVHRADAAGAAFAWRLRGLWPVQPAGGVAPRPRVGGVPSAGGADGRGDRGVAYAIGRRLFGRTAGCGPRRCWPPVSCTSACRTSCATGCRRRWRFSLIVLAAIEVTPRSVAALVPSRRPFLLVWRSA